MARVMHVCQKETENSSYFTLDRTRLHKRVAQRSNMNNIIGSQIIMFRWPIIELTCK